MSNETAKDKAVTALFDLLQKKKDEIAKTEKPNWNTNCSCPTPDGTKNIQTITDVSVLVDALANINMRAEAHKTAAKTLGVESTFKHSGFTVEDWTADFQTRINKILVTNKKKELAEIEARLDKLVSKEKREEMELLALTAMLGQ